MKRITKCPRETTGGEMSIDITKLPTVFKGCMWNEHWEFDAPAVVYCPSKYRRYGYGGNDGAIDELVEDICSDLADGQALNDGGLVKECEWRGWGINGFARRRNATHITYAVRWWEDADGVQFEVKRIE